MPRVSPVPAAGGSRVSPRPSRDEPNVPEPECSRTSVLRLLPSESARAVPDGLRPWLGRPLPKRGAVGPLRQETRKWPKERERRWPRGCRDRDGPAGGAGKMAAARRGRGSSTVVSYCVPLQDSTQRPELLPRREHSASPHVFLKFCLVIPLWRGGCCLTDLES